MRITGSSQCEFFGLRLVGNIEKSNWSDICSDEDNDAMDVDSAAKTKGDDLAQYKLDEYDDDAKTAGGNYLLFAVRFSFL